jgi:carbon-monoxide dehydrogenase medium subunit
VRKVKAFSYHKPETLDEAIALLNDYGENASILAGGTDLLVELKKREKMVAHVVDIKAIPALDEIIVGKGGEIYIGSLVTMQALSESSVLRGGAMILAQAASKLGSFQIRNRATIGGNICNSSPSGETLPSLLCLEARFRLAGVRGEREILAEKFFLEPGKNVCGTDEFLTQIILPPLPSDFIGVYKKHSLRNAVDLAVVSVSVLGSFVRSRQLFKDIRIGLGAVAPTPIRVRKAENILLGVEMSQNLIVEAAEAASEEAQPISDVRASKWYRTEMVKYLIPVALEELMGRSVD